MPVIEGEKYAFNLWFREHTRKIPYIKFNPEYYKTNSDIDAESDAYDSELINFSGKLQKLSKLKDVYIASNFLKNNFDSIISKANFRDSKRRDAWINLNNINDIITNVEKLTNLNRLFFENANIIEYKPNELHGSHLEAYDF